jgi:TetR/AcrR family transcriptional regulator, cholesterol catabolism regulator
MNPTLLFDLQKFHPKAWDKFQEYKEKVFRTGILNSLVSGMEQGYFRKDLNPEIIANLRLEEVQLGFDQKVFPQDRFNFMEVQLELFSHFVHGIVTELGRALYEKYLNQLNQEGNSSQFEEIKI